MDNNWFIVKNLEEFIDASRRLVFNNFGSKSDDDTEIENLLTSLSEQDQQELDEILSLKESTSIVNTFLKKQTNKKTKENRFIINEVLYLEMVSALNDRLVSNLLNGLVNKGLVETGFDEKSNDFVFWINNEYKKQIKNNQEKPETN